MTQDEWFRVQAKELSDLAQIARGWSVDGVGRHYATRHKRDGNEYLKPGRWYAVVGEKWIPLPSARSAKLQRTVPHLADGYASVGPVMALMEDAP